MNSVQDRIVQRLQRRERALDRELKETEARYMHAERPRQEELLNAKADRLSKKLTDIDEVLRLLEAR